MNRTRGLGVLTVAVLAVTVACGSETAPPAAQPSPTPSGSPSMDCPETIASIRAAVERAVWGKGAPKSAFEPVGVTICQYDAEAAGQAYATVMTKRTGKAATDLFALVNGAKPTASEPKVCTKELGPTYVLRFTDNERGVLTYTAESFGCRRLVATSFEGEGKPGDLASPRIITPELLKSLGLR